MSHTVDKDFGAHTEVACTASAIFTLTPSPSNQPCICNCNQATKYIVNNKGFVNFVNFALIVNNANNGVGANDELVDYFVEL